jgi:hypothetical protein
MATFTYTPLRVPAKLIGSRRIRALSYCTTEPKE